MTRDRLRTSESLDGRLVAEWHLDGNDARIHQVQNRADAAPAYAWPDHQQLRTADRGLIVFDPPPDLATARDAFPSYEAVWDAIRHDRLSAVFSLADIPTASA